MLKHFFVAAPARAGRSLGIAALLSASALLACTDNDFELADDEDDAEEAIRPREESQAKPDLDATAVSIQRLAKPTEFADTKIFVQLSGSDAKKLVNPQVLGAGDKDSPMVLRDDGLGGDLKAGDLVFTGLAFADIEGLKARAEAEAAEPVKEVPVFVGRSVEKFVPAVAFDFEGFMGGKVITLPGTPHLLFSLPKAQKDLMITHTSVVRDLTRTYDPCTDTGAGLGPWSFGHLMTEMANEPVTGINPSDFVEDWLSTWLISQVPGSASTTVPARPIAQQLIDDWRDASGGDTLDLAKAPFRLLAIVNRVDLAQRTTGGGGYFGGLGGDFLNGGEARFVFGLVLPNGYQTAGYNDLGLQTSVTDAATSCLLTPLTVIFEYKIDRSGCVDVRDWARQWRALEPMAFGSGYNAALQAITDQFTAAGVSPDRGNGSALGQLRTNDFMFGSPWQMREAQISIGSGLLEPHQVADTVELTNNGSVFLGNWIASNGMALPPESFPWAGASDVPSTATFWDGAFSALNTLAIVAGAGNDHNDFRQNFSIGACSGCHARETDALFTHIDNRTPGGRLQQAILSEFLLGEKVNTTVNNTVTGNLHSVTDPSITPRGGVISSANPQHIRGFRDLERRQQTLQDFANQSCFRVFPLPHELIEASLVSEKPLPANLFEGSKPLKAEQLPALSLERMGDVAVKQVH